MYPSSFKRDRFWSVFEDVIDHVELRYNPKGMVVVNVELSRFMYINLSLETGRILRRCPKLPSVKSRLWFKLE